jgi:peroxiredoxin Q/BCP
MIKIGDAIPLLSGTDQNGKQVEFKSFLGKKTVIYFYPKDDTPGCTTQACNIRDNYAALNENEIQIIGISADSEASHLKFTNKYQLPFPLMADNSKEIINAFGVWGEKKFMGKIYDGIHRTTFLIDEEGIVVGVITKPNTKDHVNEICQLFKL